MPGRWLGQKPQVGSDILFLVDGARHGANPARNAIDRPSRCESQAIGTLAICSQQTDVGPFRSSRLASEQIGRPPIRLIRPLRGSRTPQCNGKELPLDDEAIGFAFERLKTAIRAMIWSAGRAEKNSGGDRGPALSTVS